MRSKLPTQQTPAAGEPRALEPDQADSWPPGPVGATWEESAYRIVRRGRDRLLSPVTAPLARVGVNPSLVSLLGVVCAFSTWLTLPEQRLGALAGFLAALLCDAVDGALARRRGGGSLRGKLVDQFADLTTFAALMTAMALAGLASAALLAFSVAAAGVLLLLGFCYHSRRRPDGSGLWPRGGFFAHFPKSLIYAALALYLTTGLNWIAPAVGFANALAVLFALGFLLGLLGSAGRYSLTARRSVSIFPSRAPISSREPFS